MTLTLEGIVAIAAGTPLLTIGSIRLHRRIAWDTRMREQLPPIVMPVPWVGERGFGLGVSGRF